MAISAFLPPPARLRMEAMTDQRQALPSVTATLTTSTPAVFSTFHTKSLGGGSPEPGVFPRHLEQLEDRVAPVRDRRHLEDRVRLEVAIHAGELAKRALVLRPADRQELALEHDLGVGDGGHVDRPALDGADGRTVEPARDRH